MTILTTILRTTTISKATYLRRAETIRRRMEKSFQPRIEKVLRDYLKEVSKHVQMRGIESAKKLNNNHKLLNGLTTTMQALYRKAVAMAIAKPVVSTGKKEFPSWVQIVFSFLDRYILNKVVLPISDTTIEQVNELLQEGIDNGWGSSEMTARLDDTELPKWRARMIVRTETVRATNVAQMVQASQNPYEQEKQWIAVDDARTRQTHSSHGGVDGERIPFLDQYSNGLYFPGDPTGPAKEVINCRCTQGFFAVRDDNGNLVRKQQRRLEQDLAKLLQIPLNGDESSSPGS